MAMAREPANQALVKGATAAGTKTRADDIPLVPAQFAKNPRLRRIYIHNFVQAYNRRRRELMGQRRGNRGNQGGGDQHVHVHIHEAPVHPVAGPAVLRRAVPVLQPAVPASRPVLSNTDLAAAISRVAALAPRRDFPSRLIVRLRNGGVGERND